METNDKRSYFDNLKKKVNIVDVIQRYIHLTKQGNSWVGLCPFHDDNNPSLSVSEKLQLFKCFVCEARGDVFAFVQKINHLTYYQAVQRVCQDFGIELEQKFATKVQKANEINQKFFPYWDVCDSLRRTYNDELLRALEAKNSTVLNFLNKRGLTNEIIEIFQIGYAPRQNNFLTKVLLDPIDDEKIRNEYDKILDELGYLDNKANDFFSHRIIFPILDENENVVGFSGRTLSKDGTPKYLNSKESVIFKKAEVLFNFAYNKKKDVTKIYLVEGFMEVISLWKIGVTNAVALMGTSFSDHHIKLLKELPRLEEVVVCLDQDVPGQNASVEVVHHLIRNKKWKISLLTKFSEEHNFKDLDEFIQNTPTEQVKKHLDNSINYFSWYTKYLLATIKTNDATTKKNDVLQKVLFEIKNYSNVLIPETLVDDLAKALELDIKDVRKIYNKKFGLAQRQFHQGVPEEVRLLNEMISQKFHCQNPHTNQLYVVGRECFNFECKLLLLFFGNYQIVEFNKKVKRKFVYEETWAIYEQLLLNALEYTRWNYESFIQFVKRNDFDNNLIFKKIESMKDMYRADQTTLYCFDEVPGLEQKRLKVINELVREYEKIVSCFENSLISEKNWSLPTEQRADSAERGYQRFVMKNKSQKKQKFS